MQMLFGNSDYREKWLNTANALSITRAFLAAPLVYFAYNYEQAPSGEGLLQTLAILLLAALTDFLDGRFARSFQQQTRIGRYLDPACDKIFAISVFTFLVLYFDFPLWAYTLYFARELIGIFLGGFLHYKRQVQGETNIWGKLGVGITLLLIGQSLCLPWLRQSHPQILWIAGTRFLLYFWIAVLLVGVFVYARSYWDIVFRPEKGKKT